MDIVEIHQRQFERYILQSEIDHQVQLLADKLNGIYTSDDPPLVLGILNGSFIFMGDLIRLLKFDCTVQFIRIESYQGMTTTGVVKMEADVSKKWAGQHVIVIEDIVDTGHTLHRFLPVLKSYIPKSIFVSSLLFKEEALEVDVKLDHYCFKIPKYFVLGYGLDYDGLGRGLPEIYRLKD